MTKLHLSVLTFGAVIMSALCVRFGVDVVANYVQVIGAVPAFWLGFRVVSHLHHKRKERDHI